VYQSKVNVKVQELKNLQNEFPLENEDNKPAASNLFNSTRIEFVESPNSASNPLK
jgi:hypothetical protein